MTGPEPWDPYSARGAAYTLGVILAQTTELDTEREAQYVFSRSQDYTGVGEDVTTLLDALAALDGDVTLRELKDGFIEGVADG